MASLFTPESERLRSGAAKAEKGTRAPAGSVRVPGLRAGEGQKAGDSLGNPSSQGYEPWGRKKAKSEETSGAEESRAEASPTGFVIETATQGPELIRLALGWDRILLAQKKLCEKAKDLFTLLEGPEKYRAQRKSRILQLKSRGCIVDLDLQQTQELKEALEKEKKEKDKAKESA